MKFFLISKFSTLHFFIFQPLVPSGPALKKFQCMIVKLPEVIFFLQKSASDIFPCSRNIQISKIHATPSPRENTLIIIKLENFKLCGQTYSGRKNTVILLWQVFPFLQGEVRKKLRCVIVRSYDATFFLQNFASDFFLCSRKVRISKITGIPFPEKIRLEYKF